MYRKNTHLPQVQNPLSGHQFHGHHDVFTTHYLQSNPPILEPSTMFNGFNQDPGPFPNQFPSTLNTFAKKPTTKKGRHSKIETSKGPRDRRVRLSIGTARKFFDLQEMLGVDKPSKTLNWLLTKSKSAIEELVVNKSGGNQSFCETTSPSEYDECDYSSDFSKGKKCRSKDVVIDLAKESRAKARARARERTKEKMCVKQLNEDRNKGLVQFTNYHQSEVPGNCEPVLHFPLNYETATHPHDLIQESGFAKRKSGFPTFGTNISSGNANQNWDYASYASQSSQLCAILDQHKFIN